MALLVVYMCACRVCAQSTERGARMACFPGGEPFALREAEPASSFRPEYYLRTPFAPVN